MSTRQTNRKLSPWAARLVHPRTQRLVTGLVFYVSIMLVLYLHLVVWPQKYQNGQVAPYTIFSPITFDYLNRGKQKELGGDQAASEQRWLADPTAKGHALAAYDELVVDLRDVRVDMLGWRKDAAVKHDAAVQRLAQRHGIDQQAVSILLDQTQSRFDQALQAGRAELERQMSGEMTAALVAELQRDNVAETFRHPEHIFVFFLLPNLAEAPVQAPAVDTKALATITVPKGNVIIAEGQTVDATVEDQLGALQQSLHEQAYLRLSGIGLVLLLLILIWGAFFTTSSPRVVHSPAVLVQLSSLFLILLFIGLIIGRLPFALMFYGVSLSVATLTTLTVLMYDRHFAIYLGLGLAIVLSAALSFGSGLLLFTAGGALLPPVLISPQSRRLAQAGLAVGLGLQNCALGLVVVLISSHTLHWQMIPIAFSSGILAAVLAYGLLPIVETLSGQITPGKLVELASPENRLMRRLKLEAHGTWSHSLNVAELTEEACKVIKANWLLAKVGALYHDIGKLRRPGFFAENIQDQSRNPHQGLPPETSARIVRDHVSDGLALAKEAKLPRDVMTFIAEHHGTYLIRFFYAMAQRLHEADQENVPPPAEELYHYGGPLPQSRESGVVMLADITEAVTRTKPDAEPEELRRIIDGIVSDKIAEGQLAQSSLTLGDLVAIKEAFVGLLAAQRHHRIKYPSQSLPPTTMHFHSRRIAK